jgi:hAT family C-terminal dimerisation region
MAQDYLAIQGSATPSEWAFSSGGITDTKRRNRLSPKVFEALQMLKSAYRNGHIKASEKVIEELFERFDEPTSSNVFEDV